MRKHLTGLAKALLALPLVEERSDALEDLTRSIAGVTAKYGERLTFDLQGLLKQLVGETNTFNLGQMTAMWQQVLGLPYVDSANIAKLILGYQKKNLGLIQSLTKAAVGEVKKALEDNRGKPTKTLVAAIQERVDVSVSKARLLARDQVLKLNGQLTENRHKEAGVTRYEWSTSGDERVRPYHWHLDGQVFDWKKPPVVSPDGRHEHPGGDYQCRCVAIPIFDTDTVG